ncbi:MAG: alpha/beta hydrolase [Actinomycetota bacterium]
MSTPSDTPVPSPEWGEHQRLSMADGASLLVRRAGPPDGPTILCLSRHGGNGLEFGRLAARLGDRFHVVALDRRGHGRSDYLPTDRSYSIQQFTSDLLSVIDQLGIRRASGIGVSLGGLMLGMLHEARPDLLRAAVLVDIGPENRPPDSMEEMAARMQRLRALLTGVYDGAEEMRAAWREVQSDQWPNVSDDEWAYSTACCTEQSADGTWRFAADVDGFMNRQPAEAPPDYWPSWKRLSTEVPTMLVHGELSNVLSAEIAGTMIAGTDVRLVTVEGIGHCPIIDVDPPSAAIDEFLTTGADRDG